MVLEKTLESPLDCKEIQPVHSEGRYNCVRAVWRGLARKKPLGFNEANSLGPSDPAGVIFKRPFCVPLPNRRGHHKKPFLQKKKKRKEKN